MKNKTELISEIDKLPKFETKAIYTKAEEDGSSMDYVEEIRLKAITEIGKNDIVVCVCKGYKLIQFEEVFKPIVEYFDGVVGDLKYYWGSSVLKLFPDGDFKTEDGRQIGLIISNSVNKCLAINLNFCILYDGYNVVLPKINGFRQRHLGNVKDIVNDYEKFIVDIKDNWKIIVEKFSRELVDGDVENILGKCKLGKKYNKKIGKMYEVVEGTKLKLWDLFMDIVKMVSDRKYKREENKIKKLTLVSDVVYEYAIVEAI